jgi:phosphate transport system substrate-binding protein
MIVPAHRVEHSGTKYIFFDYLAKTSRDWKGRGDATSYTGYPYGGDGRGSERVSAFFAGTEGAVG